MKQYFPAEKSTNGRWYFPYAASEEDPMPDLVSVGLNAIPGLIEEEPFPLMTAQALIKSNAQYYGLAFLVAHKSPCPREELVERQKQLAARGWVAGEKPRQPRTRDGTQNWRQNLCSGS